MAPVSRWKGEPFPEARKQPSRAAPICGLGKFGCQFFEDEAASHYVFRHRGYFARQHTTNIESYQKPLRVANGLVKLDAPRPTLDVSGPFAYGSVVVNFFVSDKVQGPQSYFPSIEKTYGHPVAYWFQILASHADKPHMGMVEILKNQHGLGRGHANALVAHFRALSG